MELNKKTLLISSGIAILLIGIIIALVIYFKPASAPVVESLQTQINNLISGKTAINNLKVLNRLTVNNNNANDAFTLKLINNSDKNVITFLYTGLLGNTVGVQSAPANLPLATNLPNPLVLSQPVSLVADQQVVTPSPYKVGSLGYMQQQLNNILTGQLPLNNLKVNGDLTVFSSQDYPIFLNNGSNDLASAVAFVTNDTITGYVGISGTRTSYNNYKVNITESGPGINGSACVTTYSAPTPIPSPSPAQSPTLESLTLMLNNIINGNIIIPNLIVNGDLTVTGNSDSLFTINKTNCNPTDLIAFNNQLNSFGVAGNSMMWATTGFFDYNNPPGGPPILT